MISFDLVRLSARLFVAAQVSYVMHLFGPRVDVIGWYNQVISIVGKLGQMVYPEVAAFEVASIDGNFDKRCRSDA